MKGIGHLRDGLAKASKRRLFKAMRERQDRVGELIALLDLEPIEEKFSAA